MYVYITEIPLALPPPLIFPGIFWNIYNLKQESFSLAEKIDLRKTARTHLVLKDFPSDIIHSKQKQKGGFRRAEEDHSGFLGP